MSARLFSVSEVATILKTNRNMIYDLIKYGHLNAFKLGSLKVSSIEIDEFLRKNNGMDFSDLNNVRPLYIREQDSI